MGKMIYYNNTLLPELPINPPKKEPFSIIIKTISKENEYLLVYAKNLYSKITDANTSAEQIVSESEEYGEDYNNLITYIASDTEWIETSGILTTAVDLSIYSLIWTNRDIYATVDGEEVKYLDSSIPYENKYYYNGFLSRDIPENLRNNKTCIFGHMYMSYGANEQDVTMCIVTDGDVFVERSPEDSGMDNLVMLHLSDIDEPYTMYMYDKDREMFILDETYSGNDIEMVIGTAKVTESGMTIVVDSKIYWSNRDITYDSADSTDIYYRTVAPVIANKNCIVGIDTIMQLFNEARRLNNNYCPMDMKDVLDAIKKSYMAAGTEGLINAEEAYF